MRRAILSISMCAVVLLASSVLADTFGSGANQFTIDFVDISDDTNPASGYGIVNNDYRMGTYEITNDQWNKFQASYGTVMGSPSDAYDESATFTGTNVPTNELSWYEGAQFVNYLNISKGYQAAYKFTGTQGTGTYTWDVWEAGDAGYDPSNPCRNSNAYYFLPTHHEWIKAAYWNGINLQTYATTDDLVPIAGGDTNYDNAIGQPWDVGSGSEELNGTFDMMGNVWEWTETLIASNRGIRGGGFRGAADYLMMAPQGGGFDPASERDSIGLRVASVPEPASVFLIGCGILGLLRKQSASKR